MKEGLGMQGWHKKEWMGLEGRNVIGRKGCDRKGGMEWERWEQREGRDGRDETDGMGSE